MSEKRKKILCSADDCYNEVDDYYIRPDGTILPASALCWEDRSKSQRAKVKDYRSKNRAYLEETKQLY